MSVLSNLKVLWGIIIVLILLNLVSLGSIWLTREPKPVFPRRGMMEAPPRGGYFLKNQLNFTAEQEAEFDTLLIKHRQAIETKADEIRVLREELMGKIRNREFTPEAEKLVNEIGEKQSELEMLNYRHFRDVMAICNEEQKELFLQTIRRAVGPHHGRMDRPDGRHDEDRRMFRRRR